MPGVSNIAKLAMRKMTGVSTVKNPPSRIIPTILGVLKQNSGPKVPDSSCSKGGEQGP